MKSLRIAQSAIPTKLCLVIIFHRRIYSHYRDKSGLECDAVMHLRDGRYGLIKVKIGGEALIADGLKKLNRLASEIDTKTMKEPAFRMIVVAEGEYAYEEVDGTLICPIGCLKP